MQVAERVDTLIKPHLGSEAELQETLSSSDDKKNGGDNEANEEGNDNNNDIVCDPGVLEAYQEFWSSLLWPESAVMVQGMKNFLFHWKQRNYGDENEGSSVSGAASSLNTYCQSTFESLTKSNKTHSSSGVLEDSSKLRRSLESFVYGQAYQTILKGIESSLERQKNNDVSDALFTMTPQQFENRLEELQFVQPSHLEIACLHDDDDGAITELLASPIKDLISMDAYYSPYEKLQSILSVYQGVNASLSSALNKGNSGNASVLPSADDVLPTMILICIKAKPRTLLQNLVFIEQFALPEYLRGEAGYAYTNLYGAVQFLQDLKLDDDGHSTDGLSISREELKKNLANSRKRMESDTAGNAGQSTKEHRNPLVEGTGRAADFEFKISAQDVHAAHARGETVDIDWAAAQQKRQPQEPPTSCTTAGHHASPLPEGFRRSYTFLNAQPADIRVSDLSQLLQEYQMLVQVTEDLLAERATRIAAERKHKEMNQQQALGEKLLLESTE